MPIKPIKKKQEVDPFGMKWATVIVNGKTIRVRLKHKEAWQKELEQAFVGKMRW